MVSVLGLQGSIPQKQHRTIKEMLNGTCMRRCRRFYTCQRNLLASQRWEQQCEMFDVGADAWIIPKPSEILSASTRITHISLCPHIQRKSAAVFKITIEIKSYAAKQSLLIPKRHVQSAKGSFYKDTMQESSFVHVMIHFMTCFSCPCQITVKLRREIKAGAALCLKKQSWISQEVPGI